VTTVRKFSVQGNTVCHEDPPTTPAKNGEIPSEQVNAQSPHSEYDDKDTPQFNSHGCFPSIHVFTPIAETSFDVTGTSGNIGECVNLPAYIAWLLSPKFYHIYYLHC